MLQATTTSILKSFEGAYLKNSETGVIVLVVTDGFVYTGDIFQVLS
jgi:hypothetical protein